MNQPTPATVRWIVALTGIGSLMAALDTLVVATALTTIRADLQASVEQLEWTVNAYNLSFAVLLIPAAGLGDRFGRRNGFATGLVVFALASAACALAPNVETLIAARAVQGAGSALLMPLGLALLSLAFPPERRGAAIGIFSAITGLAVASGPLVGGAVVNGLSWHWIFWINVPIGLVAAVLTMRTVPESRGAREPLDLFGLLLVSAGALGLLWALVRGNAAGWGSTEVLVSFTLGTVLVALFAGWERRARFPMLPPALFSSRSFTAGNLAIFLTFASLFTGVFFFAQLLQVVLGYDALGAGLRLLPWTVTFLTVAPAAGALADRIGERWLLTVGLTLTGVGYAWLVSVTEPGMTYGSMVGPFVVAGVGVSMAIPCAQNAVLGAVDAASIGKAAGVNSMMRELGGVFGIALTVAVFLARGGDGTDTGLDNGVVQAFVDGFRPALLVAAGLAFAGAAWGAAVPGRRTTPAADVRLAAAA